MLSWYNAQGHLRGTQRTPVEVGTSVRWKPDPLGLRDHEDLAAQAPSSLPSPEDAARVVLSHVIRTLGSPKRRQAGKDKRPDSGLRAPSPVSAAPPAPSLTPFLSVGYFPLGHKLHCLFNPKAKIQKSQSKKS